MSKINRAVAATLALVSLVTLSGCAAVAVGAAVGVGMSATDRRETRAQLDDQVNELKARSRVREVLPDAGNVGIVSYNRTVLLTGEVPTETNKQMIEQAVGKIDTVKSVVNELIVRETSTFSSRSADSVVTGKVKATFAEKGGFPIHAVKIVTERGVVYLMGRVTAEEADKAAEVARTVGGVMKVVKVFEIITQAEADRSKHQPAALPQGQ